MAAPGKNTNPEKLWPRRIIPFALLALNFIWLPFYFDPQLSAEKKLYIEILAPFFFLVSLYGIMRILQRGRERKE